MTAKPSFPSHVERLVDALESVGTLELLLLLRDAAPERRAFGEICAALRCPETWARLQLHRLQELGLVDEDVAGGFVYRPHSPDHAAAADKLARLWHEDRRAITSRMLSAPWGRSRSRHGHR